ncbi:MAG TPA: hypothetical protein VF773_05105 [Verrucomicrobiae bacterium]
MDPESTADPQFIGTLRKWFESEPEISFFYRFRNAAGSKEFEFFTSLDAVVRRLKQLPDGTSVTAFRERQLPFRGVVDDFFITEALRTIPEREDYMLAELPSPSASESDWMRFRAGETHSDLLEDLDDLRGTRVALGLYPPWLEESANVMHGYVPDKDGVVRPGAY